MEAFKKIVALQRNAREFATFWERYRKLAFAPKIDEYSARFGGGKHYAFFKVRTAFTNHASAYDKTSVPKYARFDPEIAEEYMIRAMNELREPLFAKAAEFLQRDAAALLAEARKELSEMQQKLDALE